MMPLVTIVLPTFNSRRFLQDRFISIERAARNVPIELVVVDGESQDGTWEDLVAFGKKFKTRFLRRESRGVYDALNAGIEAAQGDFIYIATSDDTMRPDALEVFAGLLQRRPDCDIAQCGLSIIDETGVPCSTLEWEKLTPLQHLGRWMNESHVRVAPLQGVLHACTTPAVTSLTQILIRREVFARHGLFRTDLGGAGDAEWGLRAGFFCNVVYTPEKLATWRVHASQITQTEARLGLRRSLEDIVRSTLSEPEINVVANRYRGVRAAFKNEDSWKYLNDLMGMSVTVSGKLQVALRLLFTDPDSLFRWIPWRLAGRRSSGGLAGWVQRYGQHMLLPI
jgi:glycosyltransferase involved in cell wall biosynthesis